MDPIFNAFAHLFKFLLIFVTGLGLMVAAVIHGLSTYNGIRDSGTVRKYRQDIPITILCAVFGALLIFASFLPVIKVLQIRKEREAIRHAFVEVNNKDMRDGISEYADRVLTEGALFYLDLPSDSMLPFMGTDFRRQVDSIDHSFVGSLKKVCGDSLYREIAEGSLADRRAFFIRAYAFDATETIDLGKFGFACPLLDSGWAVFGEENLKPRLMGLTFRKPVK